MELNFQTCLSIFQRFRFGFDGIFSRNVNVFPERVWSRFVTKSNILQATFEFRVCFVHKGYAKLDTLEFFLCRK